MGPVDLSSRAVRKRVALPGSPTRCDDRGMVSATQDRGLLQRIPHQLQPWHPVPHLGYPHAAGPPAARLLAQRAVYASATYRPARPDPKGSGTVLTKADA